MKVNDVSVHFGHLSSHPMTGLRVYKGLRQTEMLSLITQVWAGLFQQCYSELFAARSTIL